MLLICILLYVPGHPSVLPLSSEMLESRIRLRDGVGRDVSVVCPAPLGRRSAEDGHVARFLNAIMGIEGALNSYG